ncbi:SirB2 family protein [Adhaeribacter soli]|uniref:C-type cytochrome n=1 Tax=Adhaeribacter soli TaxID=2607655 RepID=A0A5N1IM50_9BACT|nr:SirB2 family protein [Adhaeribacter soli]KAA9324987.1 c-type cytochrome [Adhaeribacter soli]
MSINAVQHTHVLVVILFLILFIIKAFLLFTNKHHTLEKIKKRTKVLDMVFGTLILLTGGYLVLQYTGMPTWLIVKILLVLAAIPLAIIGIKKLNKPLTALSLVIFMYVYGMAENRSLSMTKDQPEANTGTTVKAPDEAVIMQPADGTLVEQDTATGPNIEGELIDNALTNAKEIYNRQCASCHGDNGKKGLGKATDLSVSRLSAEAKKTIILNGKGLMPGFRGQISEQEAEELAAYLETLRN